MKKIIDELKELEELFLKCMHCGTCQAHCPLYQKDLFEGSVARGKVSLIESIYEGNIEDVENTLKVLDRCLLCGRCEKNCPSGVNTINIFLKAKSIFRKIKNLPSYQKLILKYLLENPYLISKLSPIIGKSFKIAFKENKNGFFTPKVKFLGNRNIKKLQDKFFTSIYGGLHSVGNEIGRVVFYPGCAINMLYFHWGEKIINTLNRFKISVVVPEVNYCCGIPAATMGNLELTKDLLKKNYDFFLVSKTEYVVCACPTCEHTLSNLHNIVGISAPNIKFIDIIAYLKNVLKVDIEKKEIEKSSLHIPCHYNNNNVSSLIQVTKDLSQNYIALDNQNCCGFGGTFNLKHYHESISLSLDKMDEIAKKDIKVLFTPCPGCAINLSDAAIKKGIDCKVVHPIEVIGN